MSLITKTQIFGKIQFRWFLVPFPIYKMFGLLMFNRCNFSFLLLLNIISEHLIRLRFWILHFTVERIIYLPCWNRITSSKSCNRITSFNKQQQRWLLLFHDGLSTVRMVDAFKCSFLAQIWFQWFVWIIGENKFIQLIFSFFFFFLLPMAYGCVALTLDTLWLFCVIAS